MVWMETYLFYCSVRLGVIVVGFLTLLQLLIPAILFLALGIGLLDPIVTLFQNDDHYKKNYYVIKTIDWIENYSQQFMILINVYLFVHSATCVLVIFGAFKLQKWSLVPFTILEFMRVFFCLTWHIILMIVLKKILNLGVLIAFTLLGGFLILYLGYNWTSCVALYQIINLIKSERYKSYYGDDPFRPLLPGPQKNQFAYGTVENVHVLRTPNYRDVDEQKLKNHNSQMIISVLPATYESYERMPIVRNLERARRPQRAHWPPPPQQQQQQQEQHNQKQSNYNDYAPDYGNWQWTELTGAAPKNRNVHVQPNLYAGH